jgi:glycerophosphoryl diester phosphodiesterase
MSQFTNLVVIFPLERICAILIKLTMTHRPYNIAHQGASALCPPNTLSAFQRARDHGADIIELDVTCTRDGIVVVSHDLTIDVSAVEHGFIPEMNLVEVKQIDIGLQFNKQFAGEQIPTLAEVLNWVQRNPIRLCVEVKGDTLERYLRAGHATVELLQSRRFLQPVTLTSFSADCIRAMKTLQPRLAWGFDPDTSRTYTAWELCEQTLSASANFLLHRYQTLTAEIVDEVHQHGMAVWAWTVDDPEAMHYVTTLGVDGMMTNRPDVLRAVQEEQF